MTLTKQDHLKLIRFIKNYQTQNGFAPTTREIALGLGFSSPCVVHHRLRKLEALRLIRRRAMTARGILVLDAAVKQYIRET